MSNTILETQRSLLEEIENLEKAIVLTMHYRIQHPKHSVMADIMINRMETRL